MHTMIWNSEYRIHLIPTFFRASMKGNREGSGGHRSGPVSGLSAPTGAYTKGANDGGRAKRSAAGV